MRLATLWNKSTTNDLKTKRLALFLVSMLILMTFSVSAFAQRATGTLRGQVLDPQSAVVSNAKVTITNESTGVETGITTSSSGVYDVPSLIPGKYSVSIEAPGFKKYLRKNMVVSADQISQADARLEVGTATETVEVSSGTAEVQTTPPRLPIPITRGMCSICPTPAALSTAAR